MTFGWNFTLPKSNFPGKGGEGVCPQAPTPTLDQPLFIFGCSASNLSLLPSSLSSSPPPPQPAHGPVMVRLWQAKWVNSQEQYFLKPKLCSWYANKVSVPHAILSDQKQSFSDQKQSFLIPNTFIFSKTLFILAPLKLVSVPQTQFTYP